MRPGKVAFFLLMMVPLAAAGCWIPLPEETAIVVKVINEEGAPVDNAAIIVDSATTLVTGSRGNPGQAFLSLNLAGLHSVQLDSASLIDPQGGQAYVPLASRISAELIPMWFGQRPYAGGSNLLVVPVEKGSISVVTMFVGDMLKSPLDNQWLTDGGAASPYRVGAGTGEYQNTPSPTFVWRADPAVANTVTAGDFTIQFWADEDQDLRYGLDIADENDYASAMSPDGTGVAPDWQIPNVGIQRAEPDGTGRVRIWSSPVIGGSVFDLYYAPTTHWNSGETDYEKFPVLRALVPGAADGGALTFSVGTGTANPVLFKNGTQYTFALKARNANSDLDTTGPTETRYALPPAGANSLAAPSSLQVTGTNAGGTLSVSYTCAGTDSIRVYAAPAGDFATYPYSQRFIRGLTSCASGSGSYNLAWLVNGLSYTVGVESFDAAGNVGGQAATVTAAPAANPADTTAPLWNSGGGMVASTGSSPGEVDVTFDTASDANTASRRLYWGPAAQASDREAMFFTDLSAGGSTTTWTFTDIPNDVPYDFAIVALDSYGNAGTPAITGFTLSGSGSHPSWSSDTTALFTAAQVPSSGGTAYTLWSYDWNGFDLARANPGGEYAWRMRQAGSPGTDSKLDVFYTYSGYYYATTEASGPFMAAPSAAIGHRDVFAYIESSISPLSTNIMGTPMDSTASGRYRQKTASLFTGQLAAGSGTLNQMVIRYNTDADGQVVVTPISISDFVGFLRLQAMEKQTNPFGWTTHPLFQTKEVLTAYQQSADLIPYPGALLADVFFFTDLATPDYKDLYDPDF